MSPSRKDRPPLCPCAATCEPIVNMMAHDNRIVTGDLNDGYSGDCIGQSKPLEYTVGGQKHINDLNHCIFSPMKGIIRFQVNKDDLHSMVRMCLLALETVDPLVCDECKRGRSTSHFIFVGNGRTLCCRCDALLKQNRL